jgi:hypothetical protein
MNDHDNSHIIRTIEEPQQAQEHTEPQQAQEHTESPLTLARVAVETLFNVLNVDRVIFVDDENKTGISLESILAAVLIIDVQKLLLAFPELPATLVEDREVKQEKVREEWGRLDGPGKKMRGEAILTEAAAIDGDTKHNIEDTSLLNNLIPTRILTNLSPEEWEIRKEVLLLESKTQRTLFLFDQKLSAIGRDNEEGIKIIAQLLSSADSDHLICGLLTSTVSPENQHERWIEMSRAHGIDKDRFVVIPKAHLDSSPMLFAQALKYVALSPDFTQLKRETQNIIKRAADTAAKRVDQVNIYDLHQIVFQASTEEGLWEPDMLFRLHSLFHRNESRRLAHDGRTLESIAAKLRSVSGVALPSNLITPPSSTWTLQHEELYEGGAYINENHLPIDLGDIFKQTGEGGNKLYILLAQPCDLMVRPDGKRHPELIRLPLAELKRFTISELSGTKSALSYSEELPYFDGSPNIRWYVKMKEVFFATANILDLCVYNTDGIAKISISDAVLSAIRPTWKNRHKILQKHWEKNINKIIQHSPIYTDTKDIKTIKTSFVKDLKRVLLKDDLFNGKIIQSHRNHSVEFNCKRVDHLTRERAIGLLMSYTATLGRTAYERDFGTVQMAK